MFSGDMGTCFFVLAEEEWPNKGTIPIATRPVLVELIESAAFRIYIRIHTHTFIPTYLPTYLPTYIHMYIHKYIHTYISY